MRRLIFSIIFVLIYLGAFCQSEFCGSVENGDVFSAFEEKVYPQGWLYPKYRRKKSGLFTIPVVVHIVHQNGPENISDNRVEQVLGAMNEVLSNEGSYGIAGNIDTDIELCLARRTPGQQTTNGITSTISRWTVLDMQREDAQLKSLVQWESRDYLNIWIVSEITGSNVNPAGYATFPNAHGFGSDGIVIESRYFTTDRDDLVVFAHELGHYLGLYHTFQGGCRNNDCLIDGDRVCDTPPDASSSIAICDWPLNTCTTDQDDSSANNPYRSVQSGGLGDQNDLTQNFMDYGFFECMNNFTEGQKERMRFFLTEVRKTLLNSKGCLEPCPLPVTIDLIPNDTIVQVGQPIDFYAQGSHYSRLEWRVNGMSVGDQEELDYTFSNEGVFLLELMAFSNDPRCDSVLVGYELEAQCPVEADLKVGLINDTLEVLNQSTGELSHLIRVWDIDENLVGESDLDFFEFILAEPSTYKICIITQGQTCADTSCTYVRFYGDEEENCTLEGDEDGDGLADHYDPDCSCLDSLFYAGCGINCEYTPRSDTIILKKKWRSPMVVPEESTNSAMSFLGKSLLDNKVQLIVDVTLKHIDGQGGRGNTWKLDPLTGELLEDITAYDTTLINNNTRNFAMADIERDGVPEICFVSNNKLDYYAGGIFVCQDINGELKFMTDSIYNSSSMSQGFADFNEDGWLEYYSGGTIINAHNGARLLRGEDGLGWGASYNSVFKQAGYTVAADVLPHPGLELVAGNTVYTIEINNLNGTSGNVITPHFPNDPNIPDGSTAVADFDLDGQLDVVVVDGRALHNSPRDTSAGIWIWNPRTGNTLAELNYQGVSGLGVPFVGDVDGDCVPEIGKVFSYELVMFEYDGTEELKLKYRIPTTDGSGFTGITMFDFNQDGKNELVYRDETHLRIIEGATGRDLARYPMHSYTGNEYPVVADIDDDGQAEILICGNEEDVDGGMYMYAFESAGAPWAPARPVWNQYAYHSTNINDDLTVPRVQQNMAKPLQGHEDCLRETCPAPYNGFLMQSTYRTQAGCVQFPAVDLSVEALGYDCGPDSTTFYLQVCNGSNGKSVREEYCISLYDGLSSPGYSEVFCLNQQVDTMGCSDTLELRIPTPGSLDQLYFAVNDDGSAASPAAFPVTNLVECNYQNNIDMLDLDISPRSLDLGPDISKCESEVMTLEAPSGFEHYLWSDLTMDSLYSSAAEGIHWLEATDQCGRVYRDTVAFSIDRQDELNLPDEFTGCPGDSIGLLVNGTDYESIQWFPGGVVGCDTCFITSLYIQDSITELIGITQNGACVYVDTIVLQPTVGIEIEQTAEICEGDSLRYFDQIASEAGTYRYTTADCDSSFVLDLETLENSAFSYQEEICKGDSVLFDGLWRFTEGKYTQMLTAANGCDSMVTLELELLPQDSTSRSEALCEGDTLSLAGERYTQAGDYELRALNQFGCDSLIRLSLAVYDKDTLSLEREYCSGDSLLFDGRWYANPDTYELMYENSYGCDSLVRLQVTEVDTLKEQAEYLLCPGDSVEVAGQWIDQSGVYPFALTSLAGCDSSFTAEVEVLLAPEPPTTEIDCEAGLAILSLPENALWGVLWDNGDTSWVTQYNASGRVAAMRSADPGCRIVQEVDIPRLPEVRFLPQFSDTLLDYNESLMVSAGVDPQDWQIRWTPDNLMSCATCVETEISPIDGQEISVELTHSSGCTYSRSFMLNVKEEDRPDIFIPSAFSPNNDGNNDAWQVYLPDGIDQIDRAMLFDRWGNKIAEWKNTADVIWDGTYRDKPMNPAVFVYVVEYRDAFGGQQVKSGDVTLMR